MTDPFHSSKYSLRRANGHIQEFERQLVEFFKSGPCAEVVETDPSTGEKIHKAKLVKPMPVDLEGIAMDTVNNLRSALDQAMYTLTGRFQYFPIRDSETEFKVAMKGVSKKVPPEICDILSRFKPYKGGDDSIWALNKIANTNKHGVIAPTGIYSGGVRYERVIGGCDIPGRPVWNRDKQEMELLRHSPEANLEVKAKVSILVAFCDIEGLENAAAEKVLRRFLDVVTDIVTSLEAESKRIGLV